MKPTTAKPPQSLQKKAKTRSITYRLPEKIVEELEAESMQKNISQNVLVKQILEKYIQWDKFANKIGFIPVPNGILHALGDELDGKNIDAIIKVVHPIIKNTVMYMKGGYDLLRCIETLEDYMRAAGMKSDHRIEGNLHRFIIQHDLGLKWSVFTEQLLTEIFRGFMPDKNIQFQTTESTVVATIELGFDFNEHDY